jgi:hypothetical protein
MRAISLFLSLALSALTVPAHAQSATATAATCLTGQMLCNKACGKGPSAVPCINTCGMKAQMCVTNNGRWPGGAASDDEDEPPAKSSRRRQRAAEPEEDEEESPRSSRSSSPTRKARSDGRCTTDAEFVHSWPVDKANDQFKFKFRVSSDDCDEYSCTGYVHYRIHFNWRSGGNSGKTTLVSYRIPRGQRSTEVTHETFPSGANMALDVRDVEIREVSCRTP